MVDSRDKGARTELKVRDFLRLHTELPWNRVPSSGALHEKHGLKGDLYVPNTKNVYCVEVKGYADDHLTSQILTSKNPTLLDWWRQTMRQAKQVDRKPLLFFKFDRSKIFVAFEELPATDNYNYIHINRENIQFFVSLAEDWITNEIIDFVE